MREPSQVKAAGRRTLVLAVLASALIAAAASAIPASATNEYYKCASCAETNGPNNWVKNNYGINHSSKGACVAFWRYNGGTSYTLLADECLPSGGTSKNCLGSEVLGHGEVESESGNSLLLGRQDNFPNCGE
jgi:hypothetical protein